MHITAFQHSRTTLQWHMIAKASLEASCINISTKGTLPSQCTAPSLQQYSIAILRRAAVDDRGGLHCFVTHTTALQQLCGGQFLCGSPGLGQHCAGSLRGPTATLCSCTSFSCTNRAPAELKAVSVQKTKRPQNVLGRVGLALIQASATPPPSKCGYPS